MIGPHSLNQGTFDLGIAPAPDPGFDIAGDVRRGGDESRRRERQVARERLVGDRPAVGIARRMAIAAGHDGAYEIETALHRRFRRGGTRGCEQQHSNDDTDPNHPVPLVGKRRMQAKGGRTTVPRQFKARIKQACKDLAKRTWLT